MRGISGTLADTLTTSSVVDPGQSPADSGKEPRDREVVGPHSQVDVTQHQALVRVMLKKEAKIRAHVNAVQRCLTRGKTRAIVQR